MLHWNKIHSTTQIESFITCPKTPWKEALIIPSWDSENIQLPYFPRVQASVKTDTVSDLLNSTLMLRGLDRH